MYSSTSPPPLPEIYTARRLLWVGPAPDAVWLGALDDHQLVHWADLQGVTTATFELIIFRGSVESALDALPHLTQSLPCAPIIVLDDFDADVEATLLESGAEAVMRARTSPRLIKAKLMPISRRNTPGHISGTPTPVETRAKHTQRLMALSHASRLLTSVEDEREIFQSLVEMVARQLKSKRVSVMSLDRETGVLQMTAAVGIPEHVIQRAQSRLGEGIAGTCAALGKPLFIDDHHAARGGSDLEQYVFDGQSNRALPMSLTVPLKMKGDVVGVVNVTDRLDNKPYSKADISFINALLGQAGFLMENARLMTHLRTLKAFNDEVIDTLWDPLCVFDQRGCIIRPNERFKALFGEPGPDTTVADHMQLPEEIRARLFGEVTGAEIEGGRRDLGEWNLGDRTFEVTLAPFSDPRHAQYLLFLHDQTGKRQMERRLVAAEKMASLGVLAAGVAHEINNPLAFVKANTRRAEEYFTDLIGLIEAWQAAADATAQPERFKGPRDLEREIDLPFLVEDISDMVRESIEGVERVEKIVLGLKSFAHPDNQKAHRVDVRTLVDNAIMLTKGKWKYNLEVDKAFETVPEVWCLPTQLEQVFMNLIVNASQATDEWGKLAISVRALQGGVRLDFADEGQGIPEEVRARIFEPFFTTKDIGEGTGLGLAIAYSILENHGGTIEVRSEVGKGTTFSLWLPEGEEEKPMVVEQASRFRT